MSDDHWLSVLSRLSGAAPVDLDAALVPADQLGADRAPLSIGPPPEVPVSARLWERPPNQSHIGVRVLDPPADTLSTALRLASAAVERNVIPVILTPLPASGFERFGFRVERLPEGPPEIWAAFEAEIMRFWDLAIVIDLSDVELLG